MRIIKFAADREFVQSCVKCNTLYAFKITDIKISEEFTDVPGLRAKHKAVIHSTKCPFCSEINEIDNLVDC